MIEQTRRSFSITDFCRRNSIGRSTVYSEIAAGRLKARKVRSRTIIAAEDEDAWLASLPKFEPAAHAA